MAGPQVQVPLVLVRLAPPGASEIVPSDGIPPAPLPVSWSAEAGSLNGELEDAFRRRWPAFRPPPQVEGVPENGSFA